MRILNWFTDSLSHRGKAMSQYKRGMAKAKRNDHPGALLHYTSAIGMPGTPADLLAMILYNRALVYVAAGDESKGAADLEAVLAMSDSTGNVKAMARQKLARMESRASRIPGRIPNTRRETCLS